MDSFFFGVMPKSVHIFSLTRLAKNCLLAAATKKSSQSQALSSRVVVKKYTIITANILVLRLLVLL